MTLRLARASRTFQGYCTGLYKILLYCLSVLASPLTDMGDDACHCKQYLCHQDLEKDLCLSVEVEDFFFQYISVPFMPPSFLPNVSEL